MSTKQKDQPKKTNGLMSKAKGPFAGLADNGFRGKLMQSIGWSTKLKRWRAIQALRTGILALLVKDTLAHGDFQKWWAGELEKSERLSETVGENLDNLSRSLRNYMALANAFLADEGVNQMMREERGGSVAAVVAKSHLVNASEPLWNPDSEDAWKACGVCRIVDVWMKGRSLYRLYEDYGVVKSATEGGEHHPRKLSPEQLAQQEFQQIVQSFNSMADTMAVHLEKGMLAKLPTDTRWRLVSAAVPALKHIALNTTDFTAQQRKVILEELRTITGELVEQLKTSSREAAESKQA